MFKVLVVLLVVAGCSSTHSTLRPPPERMDYTQEVYGDIEAPYIQDLVLYRNYIDTQIFYARKRAGLLEKPTPKPLVVVTPEPKFRPRDPNDKDLLLDDALEYAKSLREYHRQYVKAIEQPK